MPRRKKKEEDRLQAIELAYKCPYDWRQMSGDERVRFCGNCQKNVYNVSKMTSNEAVKLISEKEGNLCVRFYQRWDGKIITQDCLSILGRNSVHEKYNIFSVLNAWFAVMMMILAPMLGPALVTIVQGVGPILKRDNDEPLYPTGNHSGRYRSISRSLDPEDSGDAVYITAPKLRDNSPRAKKYRPLKAHKALGTR